MIGYYVHHRGHGHLQRMTSIAAHLAEPMTVLSSLPRPDGGPEWIELPPDDTGSVFVDPTANGTLHWVPQHQAGLRNRMSLIAAWIARTNPRLVVVDVSVEVATLCRLLGVPIVVMAMRGDRTDRPHVTAYDSAHALIATWTAEFAQLGWPKRWLDKTFHVGPISRFGDDPAPGKVPHGGPPRVLVLWGKGAAAETPAQFTADQLASARAAAGHWTWRFAGGSAADRVDDAEIWPLLCWADVVITHAGQNAVAEVAASRTPAIVIADARPHSEQHDTAATLDRAGLAIGLARWPEADEWPALLDAALLRGGANWGRWLQAGGGRRAAEFLSSLAASMPVPSTQIPLETSESSGSA